MLNLVVASSKRSAFSETSFTKGWFGNSFVSLLWVADQPLRKFGWMSKERTPTIRLLRPYLTVSRLWQRRTLRRSHRLHLLG